MQTKIQSTCCFLPLLDFDPPKENLPKLLWNGHDIPNASSVKYLGVYLDENLTFQDHIRNLHSKLSKYVGLFYKIRNCLPKSCLIALFNSFVFSSLYYCIEIYGYASATALNSLQLLQNKHYELSSSKVLFTLSTKCTNPFKPLKLRICLSLSLFKIFIEFFILQTRFLPRFWVSSERQKTCPFSQHSNKACTLSESPQIKVWSTPFAGLLNQIMESASKRSAENDFRSLFQEEIYKIQIGWLSW